MRFPFQQGATADLVAHCIEDVADRYLPGGRDSLNIAGQQTACLADVELSLICSTAALLSVRLPIIHGCALMYGLRQYSTGKIWSHLL